MKSIEQKQRTCTRAQTTNQNLLFTFAQKAEWVEEEEKSYNLIKEHNVNKL